LGPLHGIRILELAGLGPAPIGCTLLADLGADVIRIERASAKAGDSAPIESLGRNRRSIALNFKNPRAVEVFLDLVTKADVVVEGFRPGVMERLGIGPEPCLARNPKLVYARMTGWGQNGPLAQSAGHDLNYLAITGLLHQIGSPGGKPIPPAFFVGDFGSGGMLLALGVLSALLEARMSGRGQVVDAAIVDGAIAMMGVYYSLRSTPLVRDGTGENYLVSAPWYDTYRTQDGKYVSVGPLEPQFFKLLLEKLGLDVARWAPLGFPAVDDEARRKWPELREAIAQAFASRRREEWCRLLEGSDACFAPVLSMAEAPQHPHNVARGSFVEIGGVLQNAPAPRFSRTTPDAVRAPTPAGSDTDAVLRAAGYSAETIAELRASGALS
jgi:alpha-methylacyl-CoA racemase